MVFPSEKNPPIEFGDFATIFLPTGGVYKSPISPWFYGWLTWLGWTPLKNMTSSIGMMRHSLYIWENIIDGNQNNNQFYGVYQPSEYMGGDHDIALWTFMHVDWIHIPRYPSDIRYAHSYSIHIPIDIPMLQLIFPLCPYDTTILHCLNHIKPYTNHNKPS